VRVYDSVVKKNVVTYFYDVRGKRILSLINGNPVHSIYQGNEVAEEYIGSKPSAQYVHESGLNRVAQIVASYDEYFYHKDLVGTTRILTNSAGLTSVKYDFDVFGGLLSGAGPYNPYLFASQRYDKDILSYNFTNIIQPWKTHFGKFSLRCALTLYLIYFYI
jgi:hypothetical protein